MTRSVGDTSSSSKKKSGGSSCTDCTPPTLGVNSDGKRMVDGGFAYQGIAVDASNYFTPFPLLGVQIGPQYTTSLKIYENSGPDAVKHVGLAFGIEKGKFFGSGSDGAIIELDRTFHGGEFALSITDPGNVLEDDLVSFEAYKVPCLDAEPADAQTCLMVDIHHSFRESLQHKMIGTYVWDFHRNGWQNYFNHGIHIRGESMNPADTVEVIHDRKVLTLTVQDILGTVATDEYGNTWNYDDTHSSWKTEQVAVHQHDEYVPMNGLDRNDFRWNSYRDGQELLAQHVLENGVMYGKQIANPDFHDLEGGTHTIVIEITDRSDDAQLQERMLLEQKRAEEMLDKEYWTQN